ncbi:hypothetical protein Tco_1153407 [Tanacetum coccineum]
MAEDVVALVEEVVPWWEEAMVSSLANGEVCLTVVMVPVVEKLRVEELFWEYLRDDLVRFLVSMTRSTVKKLTEPLDEPEREFQRLRKAAMRPHQNESLAIAGRNLFDNEASSSNNVGAKPSTPPKTLHEHSRPNSFGL